MTPRRGPAWCATTPPSRERGMRAWLPERRVYGPERAGERDMAGLTRVSAEAFTDRYRRDGLVGVRVPQLNPDVWRYVLLDAGEGAMLWRDEAEQVAAFNIAHRSGLEGWMGPLAVRPDRQGSGVGKTIVRAAVDWLVEQGVTTLGLETMPRTVENIGFYAQVGFVPGHLTVTMTNDIATRGHRAPVLLSARQGHARAQALDAVRGVVGALAGGCDFTREILLTAELGLGDTSRVAEPGGRAAMGLWHSSPLPSGLPQDDGEHGRGRGHGRLRRAAAGRRLRRRGLRRPRVPPGPDARGRLPRGREVLRVGRPMDSQARPNPAAAPAGRRGGRWPAVGVVRERHDLPRRHPRPARRPRAAAGAADAVPHRARHGLERGLRAVRHGEPAEHARRDLERRDVRRGPRPHAAGRAGRARHHVRLAALGLRRGAARAVPRAPRGGARGPRPAAPHPGPGGVRGGRRRVARRRPAAARRHLGRRGYGRDRAAGPSVCHRPGRVVLAALLRVAVRRDAGVRTDRRRGVDRPARARPGAGRIGVERGGRRERSDGRPLEPDLERAGGDAVAEYRAAAARPAPRVARRRDELHLRGQPAPDRLHGEPDRGGASGDTGRADRLLGVRAGRSPRHPVDPRLGSRGDRDDRLSGATRARGAHATEWRTFHARVTPARRPGRPGRHAARNLPVKQPDPFREISAMSKLPRAVLLTAALLVAACQVTSSPFQPGRLSAD